MILFLKLKISSNQFYACHSNVILFLFTFLQHLFYVTRQRYSDTSFSRNYRFFHTESSMLQTKISFSQIVLANHFIFTRIFFNNRFRYEKQQKWLFLTKQLVYHFLLILMFDPDATDNLHKICWNSKMTKSPILIHNNILIIKTCIFLFFLKMLQLSTRMRFVNVNN